MEVRELVAAEMGVTENNRRARYYHITPQDRAHFRAETAKWTRYSVIVSGILARSAPSGGK